MRFAACQCIVIKQIPLAFIFHNGYMIRPAFYRIEYYALICKRPIRISAGSITNVMCIACGISEIIFAFVFEYPGAFEKTLVVVFFSKELAILINDLYFFYRLGKTFHILTQFGDAGL